jgi:hypothetical protein
MKRVLKSLCLILVSAALASCDPGTGGIFSLLEDEEPVSKGTEILNSNTVAFVLRFGPGGASDYYYAAVGSTLVRRAVATGSAWEIVPVAEAPQPPSGSSEIYRITSGVTDGTYLYLSYAPVDSTIIRMDKSDAWSTYAKDLDGSRAGLPAEPVQSLLYEPTTKTLFASTQSSTGSGSSTYDTWYKIYYVTDPSPAIPTDFTQSALTSSDTGTTISENAAKSGCPRSVAHDGTNYWIASGSTVFTGATAGSLEASDPLGVLNFESSMYDVHFDSANSVVLGAGPERLYHLMDSTPWEASALFDGKAQLSSIVEVPYASGSGTAVLVSAVVRENYDYNGYFAYDRSEDTSLDSIAFDTDRTWLTTESNYVTTLDDVGIEGFYYDSLGGVLFARATGGELWSNTWSGTSWDIWGRE